MILMKSFDRIWERFVSSQLARRLLRGAFWMGLGTIIAKGATVISSFCLARFCGKTEFGEYGMVINTASMISTVCGMGMGTTVVKYVAELKESDPERAGRILAMATFLTWSMAIVLGGVFWCLADTISTRLIAASHLAPLLRIAILGIMLGIFNEVQLASLTGCEAYQERAVISISSGIIQALLLILFSWLWGLRGAVVAFSVAAVVTIFMTTIMLIPVWKQYGLSRHFSGMTKEWRVIISFSVPAVLLLLLGTPVGWFTRTLLVRISNGYDHLAIINAATPWGSFVAFLVTTMGTALIPVLSDIIGKGERERALRLTWKMFGFNLLLAIPICFVLCLLSPIILGGYGHGFESGIIAFLLILFAESIGTTYQPMWNYFVGAGMMWTNFMVVFTTAVIQIALAYKFVIYGAEGLAFATLISTIIRLAVLVTIFRYIIPRAFAISTKDGISDIR